MRHRLSLLIAEVYRSQANRQSMLNTIGASFGARAIVFGDLHGSTTLLDQPLSSGESPVDSRTRALLSDVAAHGADPPVDFPAEWAGRIGVLEQNARGGKSRVHYALGSTSRVESRYRHLLLLRAQPFDVPDGDCAGELAYHLASAWQNGLRTKSWLPPELGTPPALWIRNGVVVHISPRMHGLLLTLGDRHYALDALVSAAEAAFERGLSRVRISGESGDDATFVIAPMAHRSSANTVEDSKLVLVLGSATAGSEEIPLEYLRSLYAISTQQAMVAMAFANGLSTEETSQRLGIAPNTVRTHAASLFKSIGVNSRAHLDSVLLGDVFALQAVVGAGLRIQTKTRRRRPTLGS